MPLQEHLQQFAKSGWHFLFLKKTLKTLIQHFDKGLANFWLP
jgi:hypothetical protein